MLEGAPTAIAARYARPAMYELSGIAWSEHHGSVHDAKQRQRLACAYLGPFLERLFARTRIKQTDFRLPTETKAGWSQVVMDHCGRSMMEAPTAWDALSQCCHLYGFETILREEVEAFPEARAILAVGYVRAAHGLTNLGLEVHLPWKGNFCHWPM